MFSSIANETGNIQVGDKASVTIKEVGDAAFKTSVDGRIINIVLGNVLYAPGMLHSLLSSSQAWKCGFETIIESSKTKGGTGILKMVSERIGTVVFIGSKTKEGLYQSSTSLSIPNTIDYQKSANAATWHERLRHVSAERIKQSAAHVRGLQSDENIIQDGLCKICALEKMTRTIQPMRTYQSKVICERVYSDVVEPVQEASLGGSVYFVTLIDDFSGLSMVRFLNAKANAVEAVQQMIIDLENHTRKKTAN